jgi:hypothetical protein
MYQLRAYAFHAWEKAIMANKLAGQRMKFTKARALYYQADDEGQRQDAVRKMAEVLADAPANGFAEADVTQGGDVPAEVRQVAATAHRAPANADDEADDRPAVVQLSDTVDTTDLVECGTGPEAVYAYGYPCAPDRLKIGRTTSEVVTRVANQIYTGTPDKPSLYLIIYTRDGAGLERVLHDVFRFQGKKIAGAGAEWFRVGRDEILRVYDHVSGASTANAS